MPSSDIQARVGQALVDFAVKSEYPDEEAVIAAGVESSALPTALELLSNARASLENKIRNTSREVAPDVDSWIMNAKTLQDDIDSSKRLANEIIRQAEANEQREEIVKEQETFLAFMENEAAFNTQLSDALLLIQEVHDNLQRAEELINERQILECLQILAKAWTLIAKIPSSRMAQAVRLLDARCFDLREVANDLLRSIWESLIVVDHENHQITINRELSEEATNIHAAITSMTAYRQLEKEAKEFWEHLDDIILKPRTELSRKTLRSIHIDGNIIRLGDELVDPTIKSLFTTVEDVIRFLVDKLPSEFIKPLSDAMMPEFSSRLKEVWLDTAVPASLDELVEYQKSLAQVHGFVEKLQSFSWPGGDTFEDWISDAPKIWISKRRETALDWTRNQLALGIGKLRSAQHTERRMVSKDERKQITESGNIANQDWDAAWDSEEEDSLPQETNRASLEEARRASEISGSEPSPDVTTAALDDDDAAEAWGWGDEDAAEEPMSDDVVESPPRESPAPNQVSPETREVTLSESYKTSSIPQPVFKTVIDIFNDGARLTSLEFEHCPVTPAAPILFGLPTLVLAMYRAVSPYYYAHDQIGNMFTYNDSIWLSDKLRDFQSEWEKRTDLTSRAYGMVKLDADIKNLESFGKRAYTNELTAQRTVILDLLGGAQNFFQQDGSFKGGLEGEIIGVINHIRTVAASWKPILAYSAWASSIGSLVNTLASKIISDIFDLNDVSVDEAERLATLISEVIKLDDLFIRQPDPKACNNGTDDEDTEPIPMTAQFANKWMKLKYLSEVLQSNLSDIKYYWFQSELSLYFTAEEVVELIGLSFENNANVRQAIREIKDRPRPVVQ